MFLAKPLGSAGWIGGFVVALDVAAVCFEHCDGELVVSVYVVTVRLAWMVFINISSEGWRVITDHCSKATCLRRLVFSSAGVHDLPGREYYIGEAYVILCG